MGMDANINTIGVNIKVGENRCRILKITFSNLGKYSVKN